MRTHTGIRPTERIRPRTRFQLVVMALLAATVGSGPFAATIASAATGAWPDHIEDGIVRLPAAIGGADHHAGPAPAARTGETGGAAANSQTATHPSAAADSQTAAAYSGAAAALGALPGLGLDAQAGGRRLQATGRLELGEPPRRFADRFLAEAAAELAGPGDGFRLADERSAGGMDHLLYHQIHRGYPVIGTRLQMTFAGEALLQISARTEPRIALPIGQATISVADARDAALAGLRPASEVTWYEGGLFVLPADYAGFAEDRLVWRLRCVTRRPDAVWHMLVDAASGDLLERRPLMRSVAVSGRVEADLTYPTPWGESVRWGMPDQAVDAYDGDLLVTGGHTGPTGAFDLGDLDLEDLRLRLQLAGPYVSIHDGDFSYPPPSLLLPDPALPAEAVWDAAAATPAARETFYHLARAHARLKEVDPAFTALDQVVPVVVNDSTASCNAMAYLYPDAPFMRFLVGGQYCANAGELADVIYHEYAHLITMYAYYPEDASDVFHEAFSDYFAASLVDTSLIGRDFLGEGTHLRNLENELTWPITDPDCAEDPHCVGQLLGGALWEIRQGLIASMGDHEAGVDAADRLYHFMRAGRPQVYRDCVLHLLFHDDDDGDLANGTPHLDLITGAFEQRNLGDLDLRFAHEPLLDTESTGTPFELALELAAVYPIVEGSVRIAYRTNGGRYVIEPLEALDAFSYRYTIPGQPEGTHVEYYFTAQDQSGDPARWPAEEETFFSFFVGRDELAPRIVHEPLAALTPDQNHLWLSAEVTDNTGSIGSVHAEITVARAGGEESFSRTLLPKSEQFAPALYELALPLGEPIVAGETVRYQLWAEDGSERQNRAYWPGPDSLLTAPVLRGRSWDIDTATQDLQPSGEWSFGRTDPLAGEPLAVSGDEVAAIALGGEHGVDQFSHLELPPLDLAAWDAGLLTFDAWYAIEEGWDGGWVEVSVDGGAGWYALTPHGGYPGTIAWNQYGRACFTGLRATWEGWEFPLDFYLGEPDVRFRFVFYSDGSVTELGWYLDNVAVTERQLLAAPSGLAATTGEDDRVSLTWTAPQGIDPSRPTFLGYNLYRGPSPDALSPDPIQGAPLHEPRWTDTGVVNGQRYYYAVTSVFATGESDRSPVAQGYPYRVALDLDPAVAWRVSGAATADTTLNVRNEGTGDLQVSFYPADDGAGWNDVLPTYPLDGQAGPRFVTLLTDPPEAQAPDLADLQVLGINGLLQIRLGLHGPLPDPESAFSVWIYLDTDRQRQTGWQALNTGADYVVVLGAHAHLASGGQSLALLLDGALEIIGPPAGSVIQEGLDSLEVAIQLPHIGSPDAVGINAEVYLPGGEDPPSERAPGERAPGGGTSGARTPSGRFAPVLRPAATPTPAPVLTAAPVPAIGRAKALPPSAWAPGDRLPDAPAAGWLGLDTLTGTATPGAPLALMLTADLAGLVEDRYGARIFVRSNDADRPLETIELTLEVLESLRPELRYWEASSEVAGLRLAWAPRETGAYEGFYLHRWEGSAENEAGAIALGGGLIRPDGDDDYVYLDRSVTSGIPVYYRLTAVATGGGELVIDPPSRRIYAPPAPTRMALQAAWPNPFRSETYLRIESPDADWDLQIVDVTGRMVRHLVRRGDGVAGVQVVRWDGRRDSGSPASQGVYYAVARSGGRHVSRSIVLIR